MEDLVYTIPEVAQILKTNKNYVYDLVNKGCLPVLKLKSYRVRRQALIEFIDRAEGMDYADICNPVQLRLGDAASVG